MKLSTNLTHPGNVSRFHKLCLPIIQIRRMGGQRPTRYETFCTHQYFRAQAEGGYTNTALASCTFWRISNHNTHTCHTRHATFLHTITFSYKGCSATLMWCMVHQSAGPHEVLTELEFHRTYEFKAQLTARDRTRCFKDQRE